MEIECRLVRSGNHIVMQARKSGRGTWWDVMGIDGEGYGVRYASMGRTGLKYDRDDDRIIMYNL